MRQRVVVKAHVSRHKPGKARGSLARHVSYLGRESASADGKHGVFYDAARDGVDAKAGGRPVGAGPASFPADRVARARAATSPT